MTDKLTDSEIIKAFKRITEFQGFTSSASKTLKSTLDLINRLQSQNKDLAETVHNLTIEKDALFNKSEELKAENERLKNAYKQVAWERDIFAEDIKEEIKKDCSYLMLDIKTIKAEAYKEFAERLEEKAVPHYFDNCNYAVKIEQINNLLKELVGEDDAEEKE